MARNVSELAAFAEPYRDLLPEGFEAEAETVELALANNHTISRSRIKGKNGDRKNSAKSIRDAVLDELSLFLCSDEGRYSDLRNEGKTLTKSTVSLIAGYIAATLGISTGVATGCVGFLAMAVVRVGVGAFCRLRPPVSDKKVGGNDNRR